MSHVSPKACSRLDRHLMANFSEEFALSLWKYLESDVRLFTPGECDGAGAAQARELQSLYTAAVLPQDIVEMYHDGLSRPSYIAEPGASREDVARLFDCLYKHCIIVEEKPITSRFWTFGWCVHALLRLVLSA